jgi:hypothetical protein
MHVLHVEGEIMEGQTDVAMMSALLRDAQNERDHWKARAEAAEAKVARVEAVRGTFGLCPDHEAVVVNCDHCWAWAGQEELQGRIDSALADAPAEQRAEGGA